jgi:plastocyanin
MRPKTAIVKPVGPIGAVVATVLLVGACGGGGDSGGLRVGGEPEDGVLRVVADDTQDFDADAYLASAGDVTVEYVQSGFQNHTLVIEGLEDQMRLEVENGGRDSGTVTLQPGRYIIYCDVAGHRDGGMEARLLVE